MNNSTDNNRRLEKIVLILIVAIATFSAFYNLGERALGNHEAYVAVAARQMIKSGNWFIPYFNGEPRLQKTPLNYWLVAIAGKITGNINELIVRLPSALLAVLSAVVIFYFVYDWLGLRIAALSAIVWSTSLCYIRYSHTGRPEMTLTAFVTIAMLSFYAALRNNSHSKQFYYVLIFWMSFALAMLAKGPAPLPLILPAAVFYLALFRQWKLLPQILSITGIVLFVLIVLSWPVYVMVKYPAALDIWKSEFFARAAGEYDSGSKPFYYYFTIMFVHFLPFSAFIPLALTAPAYQVWERKRQVMFYMWLWFMVGIVMMSLCGGKRQHYILPLMPALAILTAIILDDMLFINKAYTRKFASIFVLGHIFVAIVGILGTIVWLSEPQHPLRLAIICILVVLGVLLVVAAILFLQQKRAAMITVFSITIFTAIFAWPMFENKTDDENYVIRDFASRVATVAANRQLVAYCRVDPAFVYYVEQDVPVICDINELKIMFEGGCGIIASNDKFMQLKDDKFMTLRTSDIYGRRGLFLKEEEDK